MRCLLQKKLGNGLYGTSSADNISATDIVTQVAAVGGQRR